eukprot:SAG25_NODE_343_length_9443_cov_3.590218_16_plen_84_part_00
MFMYIYYIILTIFFKYLRIGSLTLRSLAPASSCVQLLDHCLSPPPPSGPTPVRYNASFRLDQDRRLLDLVCINIVELRSHLDT